MEAILGVISLEFRWYVCISKLLLDYSYVDIYVARNPETVSYLSIIQLHIPFTQTNYVAIDSQDCFSDSGFLDV